MFMELHSSSTLNTIFYS